MPADRSGEPADGIAGGGFSDDIGLEFINPASYTVAGGGTGSGDGEPRKRRGRPPGERSGESGRKERGSSKEAASPKVLKAETITPFVMAFHMLLAAKNPEFLMTEQEASQLSEALANYLRHSKVAVDPKTRDLGILIFVVLTLELPRILAVLARRRAEKLAKQKQDSGLFDTGIAPAPSYMMPSG